MILHARSADKAEALRRELQAGIKCVVGDFSPLAGMLATTDAVNEMGNVEAVIHNAGAGYGSEDADVVSAPPFCLAPQSI